MYLAKQISGILMYFAGDQPMKLHQSISPYRFLRCGATAHPQCHHITFNTWKLRLEALIR